MTVALYTTGCPKCRVLESKLDAKHINYARVEDVDLMLAKGMTVTPCLEVDGDMMDFASAVSWVNQQ